MGSNTNGMSCEQAMQRFHEVLDGGLMDAVERTRMEAHLAACPECAEKAAQLREMQDLLRGFAETPLPAEALANVRSRTVDSDRGGGRRFSFDWRFAAAAAAVVFVAWLGLTGWQGTRTESDLIAEQEQIVTAEQAAKEVRMVLQLASNAMHRSNRAAIKEVFTDEISPALRKVGVKWPQTRNDAGGEGADL